MTSQVRSFEDLKVWQRAMDLVPCVYQLTRLLPPSERFVLVAQIQRAAVSIPANIAEGQARRHTKEFLQHLSIARGSLAELQTLLTVAERLGYLTGERLRSVRQAIVDVRMPLSGLISRLQPHP
jgi:four helix bundle protein